MTRMAKAASVLSESQGVTPAIASWSYEAIRSRQAMRSWGDAALASSRRAASFVESSAVGGIRSGVADGRVHICGHSREYGGQFSLSQHSVVAAGTTAAMVPRVSSNQRPDDPEGLRQFKADFFKALAHPVRIRILELLRDRPMSVGQLQAVIGAPPSSVSQQLAVLRSRGIVTTERRGTTVIYSVGDARIFELLDVARRIFNAHLSDTIDLLRLVEGEPEGVATG